MPSSLVSATESSWTSTVLTLRFLPFKQLAPNLCCRQSLAGTRIISKRKRNLHMSFCDRKLELILWVCGRRAQSTSLIIINRLLLQPRILRYTLENRSNWLCDWTGSSVLTTETARYCSLFDANSSHMKVMLFVSSNQWSIFCMSHRTVKSQYFDTFPIVK